ncbi:AAA family ATPase [Streptomyces sp. NPDC006307]|uniref:AAA family ATPase n=1 Tax=Streptomyces sp. NPDC006307 TaxID=3156748 RepID=UPI0033B625DB
MSTGPSDRGPAGPEALRELFATRLRRELRAGAEPPPDVSGRHRAYREAACLLGSFDPQRLRLPDDERPHGDAILELLDDCAGGGADTGRWSLKRRVREETLAGLAGPGAARRLLECNAHQFADEPGPEQAALACLSGHPPDLGRKSAYELTDILQAVLWLSLVPGVTGLPEVDEVRRALDRARLLEPLRRLVREPIQGRAAELKELRAYTGLSGGGPGSLSVGPLVVHGPGGMGKSTLLAAFLLESADRETPGFPFAYIDFERPSLSVHEPSTLIAEAARQLAVQYPGDHAAFDALADEAQEVAGGEREDLERLSRLHRLSTTRAVLGRRSSYEYQVLATERETVLVRRVAEVLVRAMAGAGQADAPFVVVLDSFEEAQYRGSPAIGRLWAVFTAFHSVHPRLRVLISGRAPVGHPAQTVASRDLELAELDPEASTGLLKSCGVADPEVARMLADRVGGHPLSLKLAARAALVAGVATGDLIDTLPAPRRRFFERVDRMLVQGILYDRILHHIADDEVRHLAHPGLVLRVITPEIIKEVLAVPCGLSVETPGDARRLFDELARLDLVEPAGPSALRHRPDVRCIMLRLLGQDRTELTREVERRAVEFYAARGGPEARAEEIYHRLRLGENPRSVEERWLPGVERFLTGAERDLSPRAAALLAAKSGRAAPERVMEGAEQEDWERLAAREVEDLLAQGLAGDAAARLTERRPWTPCSPLHALHAETLDRLGRRAEAREAVAAAVKGARAAGPPGAADRSRVCAERQLELLLLAARLAQEDGDPAAADRDLRRAEDIAVRLGHELEAIGALLARTRLSGGGGSGVPGDEKADGRLGRRLREVPGAVLAGQPELVRAAASQVHARDPQALGHALAAVGLPADDGVPDVLGAAIRRAVAHRPGLLGTVMDLLVDAAGPARRPDAPPPSSVTGILRLARGHGTLDALARRLLDVPDDSGEIAAGVAAAMGLDAPGRDRPGPPPPAPAPTTHTPTTRTTGPP